MLLGGGIGRLASAIKLKSADNSPIASFFAGGRDNADFWTKLAAYSAFGLMKSLYADIVISLVSRSGLGVESLLGGPEFVDAGF